MPKYQKVIAVEVFLQKRRTREYVGQLTYDGSEFIFSYSDAYVYGRKCIPLGPDLPISQVKHSSKRLFPTFEDRIPSTRNPAYKEYCKAVGISPDEKDQLTLVGTLGGKGPSSFVFAPMYRDDFNKDSVIQFRKRLGFSIREFAEIFDFAPATIHRIEIGATSGKDALKRLEIYFRFPETALYELRKNGRRISDEKRTAAEEALSVQLNSDLPEGRNP